MMLQWVFLLIAGVFSGAVIVWLLLKNTASNHSTVNEQDLLQLKSDKSLLEQRLADSQLVVEQLNTQLRLSVQKNTDLSIENSKLSTLNDGLLEKLNYQKKEIEELHVRMKEQFESIASKIVMNNSQMIQQQHSTKLNDLLNPLKEKIEKFESTVSSTHKENVRDNQSLKEQLKMLQDLNKSIGEEARNLTTALKGQVKTQGNWGELILETVLEKSGLIKDREYYVQSSFSSEDGKRLQPDVIVKLPDNKVIIIDSKVSLTAYERFSSSGNEDEKEAAIKEHITSVRKHIKGLGEKGYHQIYSIKTLDFVLLFIPVEPAFSVAVQHDETLFSDAFENNIVIVSPSTLLATLRTISSIWKLEYQNKNALEIARQSGAMYDKFVGFLKDFEKVGDSLEMSKRSWEGAFNKLSEGRGNMITSVEKIKKLGAATSKSIPQHLIDESEHENDTDEASQNSLNE